VKNYFEDFESDNDLLSGLISFIRTLEQQADIRHNVHRLGSLVAKKVLATDLQILVELTLVLVNERNKKRRKSEILQRNGCN